MPTIALLGRAIYVWELRAAHTLLMGSIRAMRAIYLRAQGWGGREVCVYHVILEYESTKIFAKFSSAAEVKVNVSGKAFKR